MLKERKSNLAINGLIGVLAATFVSVFPAGSQNRPYFVDGFHGGVYSEFCKGLYN